MVLIFSEYPRPIPSFRAPVPAPDVEPTDAPLVSVCFNYDWLPYVLGALTQLTLQSTWAAFDAPPDALAMRRGASLIEQFALAYDNAACPAGDVPTPYWDNETDVDDEAPANAQTWYGYVDEEDSFIEDAAKWVVAGFLAEQLGPHAALLYRTYERRFRLSFLAGGPAGMVRMIIDNAQEIIADLSGGDDRVADFDIVGEPDVDEHTILIEALEVMP